MGAGDLVAPYLVLLHHETGALTGENRRGSKVRRPGMDMGIQKQEFYEGAALHQIIRCCDGVRIVYRAPFFVLDDRVQIHLKYSTGIRSPWGFTFTPDEQDTLYKRAGDLPLVMGLVCAADGVVALPFEHYTKVASKRETAVRVSCCRRHREHFEVNGPDGTLPGKIPPSNWQRLLNDLHREQQHETS